MPMLIPEDIGDFISYDPITGIFTWRVKRRGSAVAGKQAGTIDSNDRLRLRLRGRAYRAYRVAWFLMTGDQPPPLIDHADRNTLNNSWSNLRSATISQNAANIASRRKGLKGVTLLPHGKYQAQIKKHGVGFYLGSFDTEAEANAAYAAKAAELFGEFARAA